MQCNKKGFTILELMIAVSVFSVASLLTVAVVMGLSRQYQKGTYTVQLNDASRSLHQEIRDGIAYGDSIQVGSDAVSNTNYICLGTNMYFWKLPQSGTPNYDGLRKKELVVGESCGSNFSTGAIAQMLPSNGFVVTFNIVEQNDMYNVSTNFALGTVDMFTDTTFSQCLPTLKGGDFCSIVNYNSSVKSRL